MRGSKDDLPVVFEGNGVVNQSTEWGTMTASRLVSPPVDGTPLYKGLPEDRCLCPHWGYLVRGRMRIKYADRDEVYTAGDLFYSARASSKRRAWSGRPATPARCAPPHW